MLRLRRYKPEPLVNEWMHASLCVVICLLSLVTGSWFQETDIAVEFFRCTFGTLSTASQVPSSSIIVIVYILEKRQTSLWPTSPKLSSRHKNNPDRFSTTDVSGNYLLNILQNNSTMQSWNHNLIWLIFFFFFLPGSAFLQHSIQKRWVESLSHTYQIPRLIKVTVHICVIERF